MVDHGDRDDVWSVKENEWWIMGTGMMSGVEERMSGGSW